MVYKYSLKLKFENISKTEVIKIIDNLKPKTSCGFDGISMKILKTIKEILAEPLTIIINQMLNRGIFQDLLKIAKETPIYKKDDETSFTNYRQKWTKMKHQ